MIKKKTKRSTGNTHEVTANKGMAKNRTATPLKKATKTAVKKTLTPNKSSLVKKYEANRIK